MQESKLRLLVEHAYHKVPYYRTLFKDAGLSPGDIRRVDSIPNDGLKNRSFVGIQEPSSYPYS